VVPAGMVVLAGLTMMPLRATDPAQVVRPAAKDIRNTICKTHLIFFMKRTPGKEMARYNLGGAGFRK